MYTKRMQAFTRFVRTIFWSKHTVHFLLVIIGLFALANAVLFALYRDKTYPGTTVGGKALGSIATNAVSQELSKKPLLPNSIALRFGDKTVRVAPKDIGLRVDTNALEPRIAKRHWLPAMNIIKPPHVALAVSANQDELQKKLTSLTQPYAQTASDAQVTIENGLFTLVPAREGKQLDMAKSKQVILSDTAKGKSTVFLAVVVQKPKISDQQVLPQVDTLRAIQETPITFVFEGKSAKPSPADIAAWYTKQEGSYALSDVAIRAFIQKSGASFGISVANMDSALKTIHTSLEKRQQTTITLTATPKAAKTFTYCIQAKDVDASTIPAFRSKLASTYADPRGWSVNGKIVFQEVNSGCDFRVWLSASNQLPSFGAICDTIWSCTVKPNVIINFDRWRSASDAWNAANGSLDNYRSMVINHETGHLLGFGHKYCGGAGQSAPVMQQQSISLQGCTFNPWPLDSEQQQLLATYGIR
jgi:hypothetical protein